MVHELKTINPYFQRVWDEEKTFEVRINDRDFQSGDLVKLKEYDPESKTYSGRSVMAKIGYVLSGYDVALNEGYVVFSLIEPINCL